jgi:AraC-like DNA-binding protein
MSPIFELDRTDGDDRPFFGATNGWAIGSLLMTSGSQMALNYRRTAQLIRHDGCDDIVLHLIRRGGVQGDFAGADVRARTGQIVCYDRARPLNVRNDDNLSVTLAMPRDALQKLAGPLDGLHGRILDGPLGSLLRDHLISLARLGDHDCDGDAISVGTLALIAAALGGRPHHDQSRTPSTVARARALIDAKLGSEDLSVDLICRTLGMSRSVLYRHFSAEGGVEKYILERRLSVARSRLAQRASDRISDVAFDLGFQNASHFSTAYRLRYGVRPSETLRGADRSPLSHPNAAARVARWKRIQESLCSPV